MHTGSGLAPVDGAFGGMATGAFQVELDALPTAETADGINVSGHEWKSKVIDE
jgi:hypothetical protein